MKILALILLIMLITIAPATASPASPIWSVSVGVDGFTNNYFTNDFYTSNRLLQGNELKYLTASATVSNGTRFSLGYGFSRNEALGYENKTIIAGVDKKITENWWVAVGYESGNRPFSGINLGTVYNISPNAAVSFVSSFDNNDYVLKNAVVRTQLYIRF